MLKEGDSVYVDKHAKQEYTVVRIEGDQVTAVASGSAIRTTDISRWYDINGNLRWA